MIRVQVGQRKVEWRTAFASLMLLFGVASGGCTRSHAFEPPGEFNDKTSRTAFPDSRMEMVYARPSSQQLREMSALRKQYLSRVKLSVAAWVSALGDGAVLTPYQKELIFDAIVSTPIWMCEGVCRACPFDQSSGCSQSKIVVKNAGTVTFISNCLFDGTCSKLGPKSGSNDLQKVIDDTSAEIGFFKINASRSTSQAALAIKKAAQSLNGASSQIQSLLSSCPGPFPAGADIEFRNAGHLKEVTPYFEKCSKRLLEPLRKLPEVCRGLELSKVYLKKFKQGVLWESPSLFRCNAYCQTMTCGPKRSKVPRLLTFGSRTYLSFPENSCTGDQPDFAAEFYEAELKGLLPASTLRACIQKLAPHRTPPETPSPVEFPSGPSVEIIEH